MSLIITGLGIISALFFHLLFRLKVKYNERITNGVVNENGTVILEKANGHSKSQVKSKIMHFLRMPLLYQTSLL